MKILITGATGFLGSHLIKALLQEGHQIAALIRTRSNFSRTSLVSPQLMVYDLDEYELAKVFLDFDGFDAVIHTATCYGRKNETPDQIFQANTFLPLQLLRTASDFKTKVFINTDTVLNKFMNCYAFSKKQFAEWGTYFAENGLIGFLNIQLAQFYGPDDDESKFPPYIVTSCLKNIPELKLTAGEQKRDFIYISDVVSAYLILLQNAHHFELKYTDIPLGSGSAITIRAFVETVHQLTHSSTFLDFGALPYRKFEMDEPRIDTRALKALGWSTQMTLPEGITQMIKYYENKGNSQGGGGDVEQ